MSIYGMEVDRVVAFNNLIGVYPPVQTAFESPISVETAFAAPFLASAPAPGSPETVPAASGPSATISAGMSASG